MTVDADAPKKEKILSMLGTKDSLSSPQLASMLGISVDDVKRLLLDLQAVKLIENVVGDYYHLTYEGYRYLKQASSKRLL